MELNRLVRVLRQRWIVVVVISILGLVVGLGFTSLANEGREPMFEATAPLRFDPDEGEAFEDLSRDIESAQAIATVAASDLLAESEGSSIFADLTAGRLLFIALGRSEEEAGEKAQALMQAYFDLDPSVGGVVDELLAQIEAEAVALDDEIATLQAVLTPEEEALVDQHEFVDAQITAVTDQLVALTVSQASATEEEAELIEEERTELTTILADLKAQKSALSPLPVAELDAKDELRVNGLQATLDTLVLDYEALLLQKLGVTGGGGVEPVTYVDLTPPPADPTMNGAIGFFGGLGLAMFALFFLTQTRKPIWLAEDVPVAVLGNVPSRKVSTAPGPPWYDSNSGGYRKESIQALRTAIEGVLYAPAAFAVADHRVGSAAAHALAADLAGSFASAGWSVLLVDADFGDPSEITEYHVGEPTLGTVLHLRSMGAEALEQRLTGILAEAIHIRTDLAVMPLGSAPQSPGDAVAGRQFRTFLELATEKFDLVMFVTGDARTPAAQVLMQRLGGGLLAIAPGKSTVPQVNGLVGDLYKQRVPLLGAVMVQRSESRTSSHSLRSLPSEPSRPESSQPLDSPITRLRQYPFPGGQGSAVLGRNSLRKLAEGIANEVRPSLLLRPEAAHEEHPDQLGSDVLQALKASDPASIYEPVADYVVARVEDMLTVVPGQGNVSEDVLKVALDYGFMPLRTVRGHPSVGERFVAELRQEVGREFGDVLAAEIMRVLGHGLGRDSVSIDAWLSREFFTRHVEQTGREPIIWHVSSQSGTAQILLNGQRLTRERIDLLSTEVARRMIDEMHRELKAANIEGRPLDAHTLESQLKEMHLFEIALGWLQDGTNEEARIIYPWRRADQQPRGWSPAWSEGIRPNIAPLQRLGLLAIPVLTEDELVSLQPTG
jgi:Mrp family chromosome partitioning ATPase